MLQASNSCVTAINAASRYIKATCDVYFNGDDMPPRHFTSDDIVQFSLLEELFSESTEFIGAVTSNEFNLTLANINSEFIPTNDTSQYYNKLLPNIKVVVFLEIEVAPNIFEAIRLGTYRTASDWYVDTDTLEASVTCYDRLYNIKNMSMPQIRIIQDITVADLIELIFNKIGLQPSEYTIDSSLSMKLPYGYILDTTIGDTLNTICEYAFCVIYVNRSNTIVVKNLKNVTNSVDTLNHDNQLISTRINNRYFDAYSAVNIHYKVASVSEPKEILNLASLSITPGATTLRRLKFTEAPITKIHSVRLIGTSKCKIESVEYGAWDITIRVSNSGAITENVGLSVVGYTLHETTSEKVIEDTNAALLLGYKEYDVTSEMCQSEMDAVRYANDVLSIIKNTTPYIDCTIRGNPLLEVSDCVTINDTYNSIPNVDAIIIRSSLTYDGGLEGSCSLIKKSVIVGGD